MRVEVSALRTYMECPAKYVYQYLSSGLRVKDVLQEKLWPELEKFVIRLHCRLMRGPYPWSSVVVAWERSWGTVRGEISGDQWFPLLGRGLSILRRIYDHAASRRAVFAGFPYSLKLGCLPTGEEIRVFGSIDLGYSEGKVVSLVRICRKDPVGRNKKRGNLVSLIGYQGLVAAGFVESSRRSIAYAHLDIKFGRILPAPRITGYWSALRPQLVHAACALADGRFWLHPGRHCAGCVYVRKCSPVTLGRMLDRRGHELPGSEIPEGVVGPTGEGAGFPDEEDAS